MPSSTSPGGASTTSREALLRAGWPAIEGLVCGFGDRTASAPAGTVLLRRQVHGTAIVDGSHAPSPLLLDPTDGFPRVDADADGLMAASAGTVVGVRTADCVPLLLVAPRSRWAAAVHAGWRGTVAGIATEAVRMASEAGIQPEEIFAALGPSIGPCCYEVSDEVAEQFARAGLPVRRPFQSIANAASQPAKPHLDLRKANHLLLTDSGVLDRNIQSFGPCTRCARERFHSFRAEPDSMGRQISWIGWA